MERTVAEILYRLPGFEHVELTPNDLPLLREAACPICILDFEPGCVLTRTPCEHVFHYHCLMPAFFEGSLISLGTSCPICRAPILENRLNRNLWRDHIHELTGALNENGRRILTRAQ